MSMVGDGRLAHGEGGDQAAFRPRSPAEALEPARAPGPPADRRRRRLHPALALINAILSLLLVAFLALGAVFYFAKQQFDKPGPLDHSTVIVIPKGDGVNTIAARLEREGIIADRRIFVASVIYFKAQDKLKAGEYEIRKHASMRHVLDTLVQGRAILHSVTVPEGLTSRQVVDLLNNEPMLQGEIESIPAEGSLLPDTYKFSRGTTRQEMIERMQAEQRNFVARLWEQRASDLPFDTVEEAIVLASIVEKETGRADERPRVAGVFINRLRRKMRLQSDPTIVYGVSGGQGSLGRPILRSEIDGADNPYNTYRIDGLPPGPIANPGRAAIEAVLRPARTKDLYFVADGSGGHVFASTLEEHNRNVARWRVIEREIRAREEEERQRAAAREAEQAAAAQAEGATSAGGTAATRLQGLNLANEAPAMAAAASPNRAAAPAVPLPVRNPKLR